MLPPSKDVILKIIIVMVGVYITFHIFEVTNKEMKDEKFIEIY